MEQKSLLHKQCAKNITGAAEINVNKIRKRVPVQNTSTFRVKLKKTSKEKEQMKVVDHRI